MPDKPSTHNAEVGFKSTRSHQLRHSYWRTPLQVESSRANAGLDLLKNLHPRLPILKLYAPCIRSDSM